jgi:gliding motility-associated-like protein
VAITVLAADIAPDAIADTVTTLENQVVAIPVINNDHVNGVLSTISIITQPAHGNVGIVNNETAIYTPEPGYCSETVPDQFTYVICTSGGCDTATVYVTVLCDEIVVFNGITPNNDGVNDVLIIEGLMKYPDHKLSIFNRWGSRVLLAAPYNNDWAGKWEGNDLPDGTYFYMLEDGEGNTYTGYIQIHR